MCFPNFAGIGLAGGPCFLAQCSLADLSNLSSALTAMCASATASSTSRAQTTVAATTTAAAVVASPSSGSSSESGTSSKPTSTARRVNTATASAEVIAALPTDTATAAQVVPENGMGGNNQTQGQTLNAAAITGIVVGGGAVGLVGGILLYFFTVVRRRKMDQSHWDELEREKAAMQQSLEELKMAVQRAGTFDSLDEKGEKGDKDRKRPRTINLTSSKGPGELGVPSRIFELPASPARIEKTL
ncbi:hypothetical protein N8I77_008076 [Diaporthe amygdali]|uniref:Uncharacterized protein n=1 Tax=Phomopsis amygdali TaxID=1214568 RepID=A0AAD9SDD5_PHOAM|nr:hypothetical protein N8I77_008076 [Diaporthe amygdali]